MPGQFYDNPQKTVLHLDSATVSTAADLADLVGPAGKVGRVTRFDFLVTTAITVANETLTLDTITPSLASPPTLTLPFTGSAIGDVVRATQAQLDAFSDITADTGLELAAAGTSTAGAGSIELEIEWH